MALLKLPVGLTNLVQGIDRGDGHLEFAARDQLGQLGEDLGRGRRRVPLTLHAVPSNCRVVDDGVDPLGVHTELEGELDILIAEGVDEGIDGPAGRSPDPLLHAVTIGDGHDAMSR